MKTFSPELVDFLKVVSTEPYLILDTETTGLEYGEIVQLAVIDHKGSTLINTLVKPQRGIPDEAQRIHLISEVMVHDAPTWRTVREQLLDVIHNQKVIIYNAVYDRKMMHQSDEALGIAHHDYKMYTTFYCAMLAYAEYRGEWNDYRGSYRWQKLSDAARQMHLAVENAHDALGDCLMTLGIVNVMKVLARTNYRHPANVDPQDLGLST